MNAEGFGYLQTPSVKKLFNRTKPTLWARRWAVGCLKVSLELVFKPLMPTIAILDAWWNWSGSFWYRRFVTKKWKYLNNKTKRFRSPESRCNIAFISTISAALQTQRHTTKPQLGTNRFYHQASKISHLWFSSVCSFDSYCVSLFISGSTRHCLPTCLFVCLSQYPRTGCPTGICA